MLSPLSLLAAALGHAALGVELVNRLHGCGLPRTLVDALTAACGLALVGVPIAVGYDALDGGLTPASRGYASLAVVALIVVVAMRAALRWDPRRDRATERPTRVETIDMADAVGLADAAPAPAVRRLARLPGNELLRVALEHRAVRLDRLPATADGLKIAHLTDLHLSGRLGIAYFEEIVRRVNAWEPDLVFLTGDLVEHPPQLDWVGPLFGALRPRHGAYAILGNHDEKVDCPELRRRLADAGVVDVGGRAVRCDPLVAGLTICGDERPWFAGEPALAGDEPLVLGLAHTPDRFGWAAAAGVDLLLAGHNHGGQVCVPGVGPILCPSRHGVRYAAGTFRRGRTVMHVGRGSGSLFPVRLGCPPEVGLLTLTAPRGRDD